MTDHEMMELAAKAGSVPLRWDGRLGAFFTDAKPNESGLVSGVEWNPLTDDGDRYRLAKALGLRVNFRDQSVSFSIHGELDFVRWPDDAPDDASAILQAAAKIGRAMP